MHCSSTSTCTIVRANLQNSGTVILPKKKTPVQCVSIFFLRHWWIQSKKNIFFKNRPFITCCTIPDQTVQYWHLQFKTSNHRTQHLVCLKVHHPKCQCCSIWVTKSEIWLQHLEVALTRATATDYRISLPGPILVRWQNGVPDEPSCARSTRRAPVQASSK